MISIKKYLDMEAPEPAAASPESNHLDPGAMECYRSVLSCIGTSAIRVCPGFGADLEAGLRGLGSRLSVTPTVESMLLTETQVEILVAEWGEKTSDHFKEKADEVKELLIALAKAAESVGNKDHGFSNRFKGLINRLERIADLDDLTEIRSTIVERANELKIGVNQMTEDSQRLVADLKAQVSIYETRLRIGRASRLPR